MTVLCFIIFVTFWLQFASTSDLKKLFRTNECGQELLLRRDRQCVSRLPSEEEEKLLAIKLTNCLLTHEGSPPIFYKEGLSSKEIMQNVQDLETTNLYGHIQSLLFDNKPQQLSKIHNPADQCAKDLKLADSIERLERKLTDINKKVEGKQNFLDQALMAMITEILIQSAIAKFYSFLGLLEISPCGGMLKFYMTALSFCWSLSSFPQFSQSKLSSILSIFMISYKFLILVEITGVLISLGLECTNFWMGRATTNVIPISIFCYFVYGVRIISFCFSMLSFFYSWQNYKKASDSHRSEPKRNDNELNRFNRTEEDREEVDSVKSI